MLEFDVHFRRPGFCVDIGGAFPGPITGIFGPSGAGKTTLLRLLAGLERGAGRIVLGDTVLADSASGACIPAHKRRIGVVFQENRLFPHLNVAQNLTYGAKPAGGVPGLYGAVVRGLRLDGLLRHRPHMLSGGEARCVALGRALLTLPRLLLLDEPFTGLDGDRKRGATELVRSFAETYGTRVFLVSHCMESILALTDRLLVIQGGQAVGCDAYTRLLDNPAALPVLMSAGMVNMMRMAVQWSDEARAVTYCRPLSDDGGQGAPAAAERAQLFKTPFIPRPNGTQINAVLSPRDILLTSHPMPDLDRGAEAPRQNQVPGRVVRVIESVDRVLCVIDAGMRLIAEASRNTLPPGLHEGRVVWCLFRTESLRVA